MATNFQNLLNMFASKAPAPAAVPNPAPGQAPAGIPAQSGPAAGSNQPAFQQSGAQPPAPQPAATPLGEYGDLWQAPPVPEGAAQPTLDDPFLQVDAGKVRELLATKNYLPGSPESVALLQKGMQGDVQAMQEFLADFGRNIAMDAALTNAHVAERIARTGVSRLKDTIPQHVRSLTSADALYSSNPTLNNPALKPMIEGVRAQFEAKNPTATPNQIAEMTMKYVNDIAAVFNPTAATTAATQQAAQHQGTDFSKF